MVEGIDKFWVHFKDFTDRYVLIGGAACYLAMEDAGLDFRVTKDLDIVLSVEALDAEFVGTFWSFVKKAGYRNHQKSTGKKLFYRFYEPKDSTFPWMLELFSRIPDALTLQHDVHLTPIPVDAQISSLSAIILDDAYYSFIHESKTESAGFPIVPPECLVPLKARAWLDLTGRRDLGERVNESVSMHLKSRHEVGKILQSGPVPTTIFQSAQILGSGSASFEILRYMAERLPFMIVPDQIMANKRVDGSIGWRGWTPSGPSTPGKFIRTLI